MRKIEEIKLNNIEIQGKFWKNYMELIRKEVIPYQWKALNDQIEDAEVSGCIHNFKVASGLSEGGFTGMVWQDSDVYKWLEAVAYSLTWHPDSELELLADKTIGLIEATQLPDGYLNTYYIINGLGKRFTNLMANHELYCFGHLAEAAIAYYQSTGKRALLEVAIRYADFIYDNIGNEKGKKRGYPGHEVAEMALIRLYRVTGDKKYLHLSEYMINERGKKPLYFDEETKKYGNNFKWEDSYFKYQYYQAGKPVRSQKRAEGHAVRAVYLYSGMADLSAEIKDEDLFSVCEKLWDSIVMRQMYITGSIGSSQYGEAFTFDYDLPNDTMYGETCAAVGLVFFAKRMFELTGDGKYIDVMEQILYNGMLSGISLDGKKFFYVNPLEVLPEASEKDYYKRHVKVERQKWFGCACCPPNLARLISSIGNYAYEQDENTIYINLFTGGQIQFEKYGKKQTVSMVTDYPWQGLIRMEVYNSEPVEYSIAIRLPQWCRSYMVKVNGTILNNDSLYSNRGFVYLKRCWTSNDYIEYQIEMPVRRIVANPNVRADIGRVAVARGPVIYCLEEIDNGEQLRRIYLNDNPNFRTFFDYNLLNGVTVIKADGKFLLETEGEAGKLYYEYSQAKFEDKELTLIPYYSWSNRKSGEMLVWINRG